MNGKESRSTEYIRGWPSIDDANTDTSKGLSVSTLGEEKNCRNKREVQKKKKKKQNGKGEKVIFATRCILGGKFPREIKGKRRLINRGRGFNYCLQKWFGRRIVESFIDDGSPATGFFPRNRGLAESLDCCQLKGTLSLSLSLS